MGRETSSFRSKAVHFVSDLTTVILNPISDEPSIHNHDDKLENRSDQESNLVEDSEATDDGPDTSSFTAFLYSLLSPESGNQFSMEEQYRNHAESGESVMDSGVKETGGTKNMISRSKKSLGRALNQAVRFSGFRNQSSENKVDCDMKNYNGNDSKLVGLELRPVQTLIETASQFNLPEISEPSLLLSEKTRSSLYSSLPVLAQGRKWVLLYSTWRHGISLSTMYRRSMICPGFSLLVVGDRNGAVFGGLVEAPLRPTNKRKYQGTNNSFVFTNTSGHPGYPAVFRPTGANRYFTLCSSEFFALGGGGHFALYLDGDLLNGSSSVSETFGNPCLAHSEDFEVKELELWGFAYASKYEEIIAFSRTEAPGICRW